MKESLRSLLENLLRYIQDREVWQDAGVEVQCDWCRCSNPTGITHASDCLVTRVKAAIEELRS